MKIRVLIADDHAIVRAGLLAVLGMSGDIEVVGEADNGREAVRLTDALAPDVVVMDLMMPVMDGIDATREILAAHPSVRVLVLTTAGFTDGISRALEAGASGVAIKTAPNTSLVEAIRGVADGRRIIAPELRRMLRQTTPPPELSPRQQEILHSITRGLTNQDIAVQFGITIDGVKFHIRSICEKLGAANRAEAVGIALRKHLLKL